MKMEIFQRPWLSTGPSKPKNVQTSILANACPVPEHPIQHQQQGQQSVLSLPSGGSSHEYEYRDRLRTWLVKMIESDGVPGLKWLNEEKNIFRMPWKHAGRQDYNLEDSKIFMEWAKHSGRYREGIDKPEPIVWKTRLRCALNKMPDIRELPEMSRLDISDPYRVYELLPPMHKGKGNDDKIRRRVYKRSNGGSNDEMDNPPISPKMIRPNNDANAICQPTNNVTSPTATNTTLAPTAISNYFPSRATGSTGSQSGSQDQDSTDDLSDPDHPSPAGQFHSSPDWLRCQKMSYPIPQTPHNGMTASSIALSLLNCNPLITSDPILTSSLTSLATQVLHMEHLIQLYMGQSRQAQSELRKNEEKLKDIEKKLNSSNDERLAFQQTLSNKIIHQTPSNLQNHINSLEKNLQILKTVSKLRSDSDISTHDSPLVAQMPTDQKLQFYKIQLEKQNNKIKIIETEKNILNSQNEELQIQMEKTKMKMSDECLRTKVDPMLISMESPQSSRNSDSGQSSGEDSSTNQEEEIEVIDC